MPPLHAPLLRAQTLEAECVTTLIHELESEYDWFNRVRSQRIVARSLLVNSSDLNPTSEKYYP